MDRGRRLKSISTCKTDMKLYMYAVGIKMKAMKFEKACGVVVTGSHWNVNILTAVTANLMPMARIFQLQ